MERTEWAIGEVDRNGRVINVWEEYASLSLTKIIKNAYHIIEEYPYHPTDCPSKVVILKDKEIIWIEPDEH